MENTDMKRILITVSVLCVLIIVWFILANIKSTSVQTGHTNPEAIYVDGIVTDSDGLPVSKVRLDVMFAGHGSCTSGRDGRFRLSWFAEPIQTDREVYLLARHAKRSLAAAVKLEPETTKLDIQVKPAVNVTGIIADETGKAIRGAKAHVVFWYGKYGAMLSATDVRTNRKGRFDIKMIPYGYKCTVITEADGYGRETIDIYSDEAVDGRLDIGTVKLRLADQKVAGFVYDMNDMPVQNAEISAYGDGQPQRRDIKTDAHGGFVVEGVCKGTIQIYAHVRDRSPVEYGHFAAEAGATDVRIVVHKSSSSTLYSLEQTPSLIGKPLPEFNDIEIDFNFTQADERVILVCFWDMQQRPSRRCVMQIAEQSEKLEQNNIAVVAVQTSKIEKTTLIDWIKDNGIPFSIGMVAGDVEQTKFEWGVKSLPWLILTDKSHTVIAEGFAIDELDEKIKN